MNAKQLTIKITQKTKMLQLRDECWLKKKYEDDPTSFPLILSEIEEFLLNLRMLHPFVKATRNEKDSTLEINLAFNYRIQGSIIDTIVFIITNGKKIAVSIDETTQTYMSSITTIHSYDVFLHFLQEINTLIATEINK